MQARPVYSRPSSAALQSPPPARHERSSVTHRAIPSANHEERVIEEEMEQEDREHHPHRVFVGMSRRPQVEVRQQQHAILMAAKAQLGQHCGVKACEYLPGRGFTLEVATRDQIDHVIGKEITVYEDYIRLAHFRHDRPSHRTRLSHLSDIVPTEGAHHRLFSALVPVSVATSVEQNAVRAIANEFPSLNFSLQRQTSTKNSDERWILCFDDFVRSRKSGLRVNISQGPAKPPFEAVFGAFSRFGGGCLVCCNDHKTANCTFTTPFPARYKLPSGQYLMKAPDTARTHVHLSPR